MNDSDYPTDQDNQGALTWAKGRERLFDPADADRMKARLDEQAAPEPFTTVTDAKKRGR